MVKKVKTDFLCPNCIYSRITRQIAVRVNKYGHPYRASELSTFCNKKNRYIRKQVTKCGHYQNTTLKVIFRMEMVNLRNAVLFNRN